MAVGVRLYLTATALSLVTGLPTVTGYFGKQYITMGMLSLPYAEIQEPFMAYYDGIANKSRIDYYHGMVKTFQRADLPPFGRVFKIAPMTTESVLNKQSCFITNGTSAAHTKIQPLLPDLVGFKVIGEEKQRGLLCIKMQKVVMKEDKKNTYTMWMMKDGHVPVRYEMFGYDTLLGSHYDKYYVDYYEYTAAAPSQDSFVVPNNKTCGAFPGPGVEAGVEMNPMREYIHNDDRHVHVMFNEFKKRHSKIYKTVHEHETRKHNFRNNLRYIHSKNRAGLSYRLGVNHLMDQSQKDLRVLRGYRYTLGRTGSLPYNASQNSAVPESVDWRLYGAVSEVKDQAVCGSCWSFGTTGTLEGSYFLKHNKRIRLSQQELMDCSWGEGNNACDGGEDFRSYGWIYKHGLATEDAYGPYLAQDSYCHAKNVTPTVHISAYVSVPPNNSATLREVIARNGPISVAMDASHKSLAFYSDGVYFEPACGNKPSELDHAVLAVGYGTMNKQPYWLIKNSWSTHWGNNGYFLILDELNNCGITTAPTFAKVV